MPDIVILNGKLITMAGPDAEAIAITNGKIAAVGTTAEIRAIAGDARIIDAAGGTVLPGFIDSHVHLFGGSAELDYLNLNDVAGADALAAAVRPYAAARPNDNIVFAASIDYSIFGDRAITRHDLDIALPDRPFAAMSADHHTVWANTKALEIAGIFQGLELSDGSEIVMGDDGFAAGELREPSAFGPVLAKTALGGRELLGFVTGNNPVPAPGLTERAKDKAILAKGLAHCAASGITGLHNMDGNFYQLELLSALEAEGTLPCRIEVPMHMKNTDPMDRLAEAEEMRAQFNTDMVWSNRVKMFMDGVLDSRTAFMLENYPGTSERSEPMFTPDQFNEICTRVDAKNLQIAVHAIGDAAVRQTLDGYEAARKANGPRDSRHRIEHIETIHPDDIPRIAALGAVASIQPLHSPAGGFFPPYPESSILHDAQYKTAFAWKNIRDTGAPVVFSTDWPVVPVEPMLSVQGAVYRPPALPDHWPDQTQGLRETLASYTRDNAWVEFNEHRKGALKPGMMADIVILDSDIEATTPENLGKIRPSMTICGGNITHEA
ncbi:MAG: amidohydrolase [Pikeienuella sp.]